MPEFRLVPHADRSPTSCALCGDFAGPFIDTSVTIPHYGAVFICTANDRRSGCLTTMGELTGMASAAEKQDLYDELNGLTQEVSGLEEEVAAFNQLVELQSFFAGRPERKLVTTSGEEIEDGAG